MPIFLLFAVYIDILMPFGLSTRLESEVVPTNTAVSLLVSGPEQKAMPVENKVLDVTITSVYVRDANTHEALSSAKSGDDFEFVICVDNSSGEEESITLSWVATAPDGREYGPFTRKREDKTIGDGETCYDNGRLEFPYNSASGEYSFLGVLHASSTMTGSSLLTTVDVTAINTQPIIPPAPLADATLRSALGRRARAGEDQVTEIQAGSLFYPFIHWENKVNTTLSVTWYVNVYYNDLVIMHQHGAKGAEPGPNDWGMATLDQADWVMPSDTPLGTYTLKGAICGGLATKNAFSNCKELAMPFSVVEVLSATPTPPAQRGGGATKRHFLPVIYAEQIPER